MSIPLEICIDRADGLLACERGGADRIELCSALPLGGLTPSLGLMQAAAQQDIPVHVMIRPQIGGFEMTDAALDVALSDIACAKKIGLAGVVIGALTPQDELDHPKLRAMINAADGMQVTLHRAFDLTRDPILALEQAIDLGIHRLLTSGGALSATEGAAMLHDLKSIAGNRIRIAAGSGVTAKNVGELIRKTGVDEVHASCAAPKAAHARAQEMGFGPASEKITDAQTIRDLKSAIREAST